MHFSGIVVTECSSITRFCISFGVGAEVAFKALYDEVDTMHFGLFLHNERSRKPKLLQTCASLHSAACESFQTGAATWF